MAPKKLAIPPPLPPCDDPMRISETCRDEIETARLLKCAKSKAVLGLWRFNGVDDEADPVNLFMGIGLGLMLLMEQCHYRLVCENAERLEAMATPEEMAKANRLVKAYRSGMKDAERTIRGQTKQLELF